MAVFLSSSNPFFYASFQSIKQPLNTNKFTPISFNLPSKNYTFSSLSIPYSFSHNGYYHGSHDFKCFVSAQDDSINTMEEEKEDEQEVGEIEDTGEKKKWESVETLTRFYKEAILAGDFHTVAEIETAFYRLETENSELVDKISTMSEEITAGKERYIRLQADFDNFRKRSEKEKLSVRSDAQGEVIESLLPMVDNFERAKQQLKPETDREKQIDTSYQGIYKQFVEIMRSLRVSVVATVGKPFDPTFHEAIAREESEEFKEGIVSQEFRRGFILGDRLLRPAMVKVSSGIKKPNSTEQPTSSREQPATTFGVDE
ncbi:uncharacterized protein LOC141604874 [Silene latifolia]|uniref:uncharacterized protein LOC141604874 n=1 Tax=Silene latifolia TaxID=37657 RepID=UPI003D77C467